MAENMIKFLRGNVASLPQTATEGALYFTKDEGVYLGLADGSYHRYGDFIQVNAVADLPVAGAHVNCMYYCVAENILAKWDGKQWVQINKQKTLAELGGVAKSVYEAKMTALEKADSDNATAISNLSTLVGTIPEGAGANTVIAYINKKTDGIATSGNLEALASRVTDAESDIDNLQAAIGEGGSVTVAIADAKKAGTDAAAAVDALEVGQVKTNKEAIEAINNETTGILAQAKSYADGKDTAISAAKAAADAAQADVDALEGKVGTVPADKTVVQMISDAQAAATYDDTALKGRVSNIEKDYLKAADKTELSNSISGIDTAYKAADTALSNRVEAIEDNYLKAADKTELANSIADVKSDVDTFLEAANIGGEAIDTLKEIQDYISSDGTAAAGMTSKIGALETTVGKAADGENPATGLVKSVADNAAAIATEKSRAEGVEVSLAQADADNLAAAKKYSDDAITALKIGDYAKQSDLDTHTGDTTVHITADERSKWNAADGKAHTHSNKALLDTYTQTEENLADAVAKKHSHANVAELDKIADGDVAKWNAAQANAEATAATALSSAKTELEGKITAAQTAAEGKVTELANGAVKTNTDNITALQNGKADKATTLAGYGITDAYTKTETYTKDEVQKLLTWGEF